MIYIQDIILNLNKDFIEFFEWNNNDYLTHIRKIPIFKIDSNDLFKIKTNNIIDNKKFLESIKYKCSTFSKLKYDYLFLVCTEEKVLAISSNSSGEIKLISDLLIEEEDDILDDFSKYPFINLSIIVKNETKYNFLTRKENDKINYVLNCLENIDPNLYDYLCFELDINSINKDFILNNYNKMYNFFNLIQNKK